MEATFLPPETPTPGYPATYSVDYPDRELNRVSTFFRAFTVIPIALVLAAVEGGHITVSSSYSSYVGGSGVLFLPVILMVLFRKKYPRWWFDFNLELLRFQYRISAYFALMSDVYPSTDEEQYVHLDLVYPDAEAELQRGMPLVKWFLALPHYIVLCILAIGAFFAIIGAWFAILFTGRYPRSIFNYVSGVQRWSVRVTAYSFALTTDRYPPFSLD